MVGGGGGGGQWIARPNAPTHKSKQDQNVSTRTRDTKVVGSKPVQIKLLVRSLRKSFNSCGKQGHKGSENNWIKRPSNSQSPALSPDSHDTRAPTSPPYGCRTGGGRAFSRSLKWIKVLNKKMQAQT